MDVGDWIATGAAVVAIVSASITFWQAREAKKSRKAAEDQAGSSRTAAAAAEGQAMIAKEHLDLARAERADRERLDEREAVVELLRSAPRYAKAFEGLLMFLSVVSDTVEQANSWTHDNYLAASREFDHALVLARLAIVTPALREQLDRIQSASENALEPMQAFSTCSRDARGRAPMEVVVDGRVAANRVATAIQAFEDAALEAFSAPRREAVAG
ncbi:hypothetical protein [Amycolatopsis sp. NPDC051903]|uniref:hypothetical protein n=1 Tax=Amycolatopsis sp. NPDC051903 TaxID=3363936 RepID=UPI0037AE15B8